MQKLGIEPFRRYSNRLTYALIGVAFGLIFPVIAGRLHDVQFLYAMIETAPVFLGLFAYVAGGKEDKVKTLLNQRLEVAEREATYFKSAFDKAAIVAVTDNKGKIVYANEAFTEISGYSLEEILGNDHRIVNSGTMGKAFFTQMWGTIGAGKIWRGEICNRNKQGGLYWVDTTIVPSLDAEGHITHYTSIRHEITARKKMERELSKSLEMQKAILESASYAIISVDTKGIIQSFNRGAENLLGYRAEEVVQKFTPDLFHDAGEVEARAQELTKELGVEIKPGPETFTVKSRVLQGPVEHEWTYIRKDGSRLPVNLTLSALFSPEGELVGYLGFAKDISDRRRLESELVRGKVATERSERQVKLLLKVAAIANQSRHVAEAIQSTLDVICREADMCVGHALYVEHGPEVRLKSSGLWSIRTSSKYKTFVERSVSLEPRPGEDVAGAAFASRQPLWLAKFDELASPRQELARELGLTSAFAFPISLGDQVVAVLEFFSDHELKPTHMALEVATQFGHYLAQVYERSQAAQILEKQRDVAAQAAKTKSSFLANMSHEIRTPLNGIIGNTALLGDSELTSDQRDMLDTIRNSSNALLTLIDDILDFSKIEAGKLEIELKPFDLRLAAAEAIGIVSLSAQEKAISLTLSIDENVSGVVTSDYVRFRQILLNLLSNAIKFTKKGGVDVKLRQLDGESDKITIQVEVHDSGIGMTLEQQSKLFSEFSQVDASTTRKYGGTGLGLAICKQLCSLLGGKIWVESASGKGSIFYFSIKAQKSDDLTPVNRAPVLAQATGTVLAETYPLAILVAEDNPTNQILAAKFFKKLGYTVDIVANGVEAVNACKAKTYDILFMDIHMPVLDGSEATKAIRLFAPKLPHIVALTANVMKSDREAYFAAGMNDFLKKPLQMEDLSAVLELFISTRYPPQASLSTFGNLPSDLVAKKFLGDFDIFVAVAKAFLGDYRTQLAAIEECIRTLDAKGLERAAHTLKGAASNFTNELVAPTAADLEVLGRKGDFRNANHLVERLKGEVNTLAKQLDRLTNRKEAA